MPQAIAFQNIEQYIARVQALNGAPGREMFSVEPSVAQRFENYLRERYTFLSRINVHEVPQMKGQKLGITEGLMIGARTGTGGRQLSAPGVAERNEFELHPGEYDTLVSWDLVDSWAGTPGFQERIRDFRVDAVASTRQTVGFHGVQSAAITDSTAYPLGEDLHRGWLQTVRERAPQRVMQDLTIGPGGDYKTLDAMVIDAVGTGIDEIFHGAQLVVIAGHNLLLDHLFTLASQSDRPSEAAALGSPYTNKTLGGLPVIRVPGMLRDAVFITPLKNLSYYHQRGSRREEVKNDSEAKGLKHYLYLNECYELEDVRACTLLERVTLIDTSTSTTTAT